MTVVLDGEDAIRARDELRFMAHRMSNMNRFMIEAFCILDECIDNNGEIHKGDLHNVKRELRKYEDQRRKLDKRVLIIDQLINP